MSEYYKNIKRFETEELVDMPSTFINRKDELRGIWVATVANLDTRVSKDVEDFKNQYLEIINNIVKSKMNMILFQVRPTNDAYYVSKYNPYSQYLFGEEGKSLGFDPLKFMTKVAHENNLEFHAWLNPYRISTSAFENSKDEFLETLHKDNFARIRKDLVVSDVEKKMIFNPGEPEVIDFIVKTIGELCSNYDIDAIHFDDYFYPYAVIEKDQDITCYEKYNENNLSYFDWRVENVDTAIFEIHQEIKRVNKEMKKQIEFGISPFCVWRSKSVDPRGSNTGANVFQCYDRQYADIYRWVKEGWIDYVVPQNYLRFSHPTVPYADMTDWWVDVCKGTNVKLYIGIATYRINSKEDWLKKDEVLNQLKYNSHKESIKGNIFFSYKNTLGSTMSDLTKEVMNDIVNDFWKE